MTDGMLDATTQARLDAERDRLLATARSALADGRFWWLDDDCRPDRGRGQQLWITARMTHVLGLSVLLGNETDGELVDAGLASIDADFGDAEHDGWFPRRDADGRAEPAKTAYEHAFVLLAAASSTIAGRPRAADLLGRAAAVVEEHFWDETAGALRESWDAAWTTSEDYRGANANMHAVEAFLAAGDATGDDVWGDRCRRIVDRVVNRGARAHDWRIPEHYDGAWHELPDYNGDQPRHAFRPYGVTPGHGFEWARLVAQLGAPVGDESATEVAAALFGRALTDGWDGDEWDGAGDGGLVYTTDWSGRPVVRERFHWVVCEAMATACTLWAATDDPAYAERWQRLWDHARHRFVDLERGGWWHELGVDGRPSRGTWSGKPDVYHALQAVLLPSLPPAASVAGAVRARSGS